MIDPFEKKLERLMSLSNSIKQSVHTQQQSQVLDFHDQLNDLMADGWRYALGHEHEIEETQLPLLYVAQRNNVIDDLQIQLAQCALRYRATPVDSNVSDDAIAEYHQTFAELVRITGCIIGLDPDAELPDNIMPKAYVDHWG